MHTEIHTGQMLFSCCYHCDAFKKFKQTCQLFCKPWISCFSISTQYNIGLTEDCAEDILQALSERRHKEISSVQRSPARWDAQPGSLDKYVCTHTHTRAKVLRIYYITARVLTVLWHIKFIGQFTYICPAVLMLLFSISLPFQWAEENLLLVCIYSIVCSLSTAPAHMVDISIWASLGSYQQNYNCNDFRTNTHTHKQYGVMNSASKAEITEW